MDKKANNAKTKSTKAAENKDENKKSKDQKDKKAKDKPEGEVTKRPRNGYQIFCAENREKVKQDNPTANQKEMLSVKY
jgi:hypothetical protein